MLDYSYFITSYTKMEVPIYQSKVNNYCRCCGKVGLFTTISIAPNDNLDTLLPWIMICLDCYDKIYYLEQTQVN